MTFGDILIYITAFFGLYTAIYFILTVFEAKIIYKGETNIYKKVTICVPCYNEETTVEKTLLSLISLDYKKDMLEIIVVDDGSSDNTYTIAKAFAKKHPDHQIKVYKKKNGGKHTALNLAIKKSTGEFFGALDADSFVDKLALRRIMKFFEDEEVTAVTPSMKVQSPKGFWQHIQSMEYLMGIFLRKAFAELGSIHVTPGPFSIYRMTFFQEQGDYVSAHLTEDIEMALRAQRANKVIENSVDAYVYTVAPDNFNMLYKQRLRWYVGFLKNIMDYKDLFSRKHGNLGLFILPSSFISVGLVIIFGMYFLIRQIDQWITSYVNLAAINFDFSQMQWFRFETFFINLTPPAIIGFAALGVSIGVILFTKRISKEPNSILKPYILFALFYWMFFGFWWLVSTTKVFITKQEVKWGHKSE